MQLVSQCRSRWPLNQSAICNSTSLAVPSAKLHHHRGSCHKWPTILVISVIVIVVLALCAGQSQGQFLKPPKKLHRVIAGFYAYHPSYDTDQRAPIATRKPSTVPVPLLLHDHRPYSVPQESQKNAFHYSYHAEHDVGGDYNFHNIYGSSGSHRPKYHTGSGYHRYKTSQTSKYRKVKKSKEYEKKRTKYYRYKKEYHKVGHGGYVTGGFHSGNAPYWPHLSKIYEGYLMLAAKMAEFYGRKYNYPSSTLYWQIIDVMFD